MSLGQMIKLCRKEKNLTQIELSLQIGVSMQAVSKWETDSGMPDISQIVPLARVLEVSADKLLGLSGDKSEEEFLKIKEQIGHHGFCLGASEACRIYNLVQPFFQEHPNNPEAALWCLQSITEMLAAKSIEKDKSQLIAEGERYAGCIFRYESNADTICEAYYVMARFYNLLEEKDKADSMLEKLPFVFGDRNYWEAETAWADRNAELTISKCKESFAFKARFISRCIRMIAMINYETDKENGLKKRIELDEYMLRIINAFLSGGDYLPHRQIYQKTSLLSDMVGLYVHDGDYAKALDCQNQLVETKKEYFTFLKNPYDKHCLMFIEGDPDAKCKTTKEYVNGYVTHGFECLESIPEIKNSIEYNRLLAEA